MTPAERRFPKTINGSRKKRIANGAGQQIQDVNRLLKQHLQMEKMMKKVSKGGMKKMMRGMPGGGMPPGGMPPGFRLISAHFGPICPEIDTGSARAWKLDTKPLNDREF